MSEVRKYGLIKRFIRFITFVDLPIRRKFSFFAVGVLFWFIVLSCVSFYVLVDINIKTAQVLDSLLPYERFAQVTLRKANEMTYLLADLNGAVTQQAVVFKSRRIKSQLETIKQNLEQLHSTSIVSPVRLIWKKISDSAWLDDQGNNAYLAQVKESINELSRLLQEIELLRNAELNGEDGHGAKLKELLGRFVALESQLTEASVTFLESISTQTNRYSNTITTTISFAFWTIITVLIFASGLLAVFTFWISNAIVCPVMSMITKIHSLATGHVDLTDKIVIRSDDEIGEMSREFNDLMDTVHGMTIFKSVIEEDSTLEDVYSRMGEAFATNVGIEKYQIYEVTADSRGMQAVYPVALSEKDLECHADILSCCEQCRAVKTGHPVSSLAYNGVCKQFKDSSDKLHVCIPMIIGGHAGGVVQFVFDRDRLSRTVIEQQIARAEAYIKQSLSVLEAKRLMNTLRESSLRDPMTGLFNRRFLQEQASYLIAGTLRRKKSIGLLMCDIDFFKQVNDQYGHDAGDQVLKETSAIISDSVRESDVVVRFGGEEFLVILNDIEDGMAIQIAEKIRTNIEAKVVRVGAHKIRKTISLGVSEFPSDSDGFWQAIKYADVALYQAKTNGRNQSVRFDEEMWTEEEF